MSQRAALIERLQASAAAVQQEVDILRATDVRLDERFAAAKQRTAEDLAAKEARLAEIAECLAALQVQAAPAEDPVAAARQYLAGGAAPADPLSHVERMLDPADLDERNKIGVRPAPVAAPLPPTAAPGDAESQRLRAAAAERAKIIDPREKAFGEGARVAFGEP